MKIHFRPPPTLPPAPPPSKPSPNALQIELQAEALIRTAQQYRTRRSQLFGARRDRRSKDDSADSDQPIDQTTRKIVDFVA